MPPSLRDVAFKDNLPDTLFALCGSEGCDMLSDILTGQQVENDRLSLTTQQSKRIACPSLFPKCFCVFRVLVLLASCALAATSCLMFQRQSLVALRNKDSREGGREGICDRHGVSEQGERMP